MKRGMILVLLVLFGSTLSAGCIPLWGKASGNRYECMNSGDSDRADMESYESHPGT